MVTWIEVGSLPIASDTILASFLADRSSLTADALRLAPLKDPDGTPLTITEAMIDGDAGWWNWKAVNLTGYVLHASTSTGFAGAGIIGLGSDVPGSTALVISNKANGSKGAYLDNMNTIDTDTSSFALHVRQASISSAAAYFEPYLANSKPALRLGSGVWGNNHHVLMDHVNGPSEASIYWQVKAKDGVHLHYAPVQFGGAATSDASRLNGLTIDYASSETRLRFYRRASSGVGTETWYPHHIRTVSDELQLGSASTSIGGTPPDGTETIRPVIRLKGSGGVMRLGFFDTAPVVQPTAWTQTYATASKTVAAATAVAVATTAPTAGAFGFTSAQAVAIIAAVNALILDRNSTTQNVNAIIDDLQALGLGL